MGSLSYNLLSIAMRYGGPTAMEALGRLIQQLERPNGYEPAEFDLLEETDSRFVYEMRSASETCPDCGGTGKYVGLNIVEECPKCGGSGRI